MSDATLQLVAFVWLAVVSTLSLLLALWGRGR